MSEYNAGDKIKAFVRGADDTVIHGTLVESEGSLSVGSSSWTIQELLDSKFEIEILERAPVIHPIPVGATLLLDKDGDIWRLATGIGWYCATEPASSLRAGKRALDDFGPFAVLRPEAETALALCADLRTICQEVDAIPSEIPLTMATVYVLIDTVLEKYQK
jgi:hypothetical protein